jgi:uncharacterized membrane protein YjjB (DUF3815 family)
LVPGVTIVGHVVLTLGICLLLQPSWGDLVLAAAFGAFVGAFKLVGARWPSVQMITPVTAAFVIAAVTFLLAGQGWADADLRAMVPPIVTFLPGGMLTMAVVELAAAEMVSGASRLVTGAVQLLLLAFGITGAAQVVGIPTGDALIEAPSNLTGVWVAWLAVPLVAVGNFLYFSAPRRSLGWLCLVLVAASVGQYLGDLALGGYLSGFVGAIVMTPVAYLVERRPSGPPALVSFLPAFWLLVPGPSASSASPNTSARTPSRAPRICSAPSARWWRSPSGCFAATPSTARWPARSGGFGSWPWTDG